MILIRVHYNFVSRKTFVKFSVGLLVYKCRSAGAAAGRVTTFSRGHAGAAQTPRRRQLSVLAMR